MAIKALTCEVSRFPSVIESMKTPMMNDFILRGACVYENSRPVIETMTSAAVMSA